MPKPTNSPPDVPTTPFEIDARAVGRDAMEGMEWLLTTGHGGFAMGCPAQTAHRQYHGLLNGAWRPPTGRIQTVHSIDEAVRVGRESIGLALHRYTDPKVRAAVDAGALVSFTKRRAEVEWVYETMGVRVIKRVRVGWGANTGAVRYRVEADEDAEILLRPNISMRDMHHVKRNTICVREDSGGLVLHATEDGRAHECVLHWDRGVYEARERRTSEVSYATALVRTGEDSYGECLWSPGVLCVDCPAGVTEWTVAYALSPDVPDSGLFETREREAHFDRVLRGFDGDERLRTLVEAADDFLVDRTVNGRSLKTVIAGYPWFGDWGRDTMIALPGLMLTPGRFEDARACLETFAAYESEGMIPNLFDADDTPAYNTVDASLWFLHAVHAYSKAAEVSPGDGLLRACHAIIDGYRTGTRYGIGVDDDGLVYAGDAQTQLTWMDAKRDGIAFSPRYGKCVEINALWVHGLRCIASLCWDDDRARAYEALAERGAASFNTSFVRADRCGLYDCLRPTGDGGWDGIAEIRPNQVFAVSLERTPLAREHWASVIGVCREHLLTDAGMRTLSPADPGYRGRFKGDMMDRDAAYHNGTVWPWPLGAYCEAVLRAGDFGDDAEREAREALRGLVGDLSSGCLGQIAEVYDGDAPRDQEGCCAQAWSVAEVLRVLGMMGRRSPPSGLPEQK